MNRHPGNQCPGLYLPEAVDAVPAAVGRGLAGDRTAGAAATALDLDGLVQVVHDDCVLFDDRYAHPALRPVAGVTMSCFHNLTLTA